MREDILTTATDIASVRDDIRLRYAELRGYILHNRDIKPIFSSLSEQNRSDFITTTSFDGLNLLSFASKHGNVKAFNDLKDMGAEQNSPCQGMLPIFHAAYNGKSNIVKLILASDPEQAGSIHIIPNGNPEKDDARQHLIDVALTRRYPDTDLCKLLINNPHCDINHLMYFKNKDPNGDFFAKKTPLTYSMDNNQLDLAEHLINSDRIDLNLKNRDGTSSFEVAQELFEDEDDIHNRTKYHKISMLITSKLTKDVGIKEILDEEITQASKKQRVEKEHKGDSISVAESTGTIIQSASSEQLVSKKSLNQGQSSI